MIYHVLLFIHVVGACVLLGTGAGIAFFMLVSHRSGDPALIAHTAQTVVLADTVFTATAAIFQPITGWLLARELGWSLQEGWLLVSIALYVVVGAFWLPVVWIQIRLLRIASEARDNGTELSAIYHRMFAIWFACGFPAFFSVLGIVWLMLVRPDIGGWF